MKKNMPTNPDTLALYCPACSYTCKNNMDFLNHHKSFVHKNQMDKVAEMPFGLQKEVQEACNKILQQRDAQKTLKFCTICDLDLPIPYSDHKNSEMHKIRSNTLKVGCVICKDKSFVTFPQFKAHCRTDAHIEKADVEREKMDKKIDTCKSLKDFPSRQDGVMFGQRHVKYVEGSYCTVCKRFWYTEEEALEHTKHKSHYNSVKDLYFSKKNNEPIDFGEYPEPENTEETTEITIKLEDL